MEQFHDYEAEETYLQATSRASTSPKSYVASSPGLVGPFVSTFVYLRLCIVCTKAAEASRSISKEHRQ